MEKIRSMLAGEELEKIPTSDTTARESSEVVPLVQAVQRQQREFEILERNMLEWNEELALLAQALIARPKVGFCAVCLGLCLCDVADLSVVSS